MIALIRGSQVDLSVTTVVLAENPNEPLTLKMWHCPTCQNRLFQHGGNIIKIMPGHTPITSLPIVIQCGNCHANYLIERIALV